MFTFTDALIIAAEAHRGVKDDGGIDYIKHSLQIYHKIKRKGGSNEAQMTAILHDVLEDTNVTEQELIDKGVPESVIEALKLMKHVRDQKWVDERIEQYMELGVSSRSKANAKAKDEEYLNYIVRLSKNDIARMVKIEDLLHNGDLKRQPSTMDAEYLGSRLIKYGKALRILTGGKVGYC